MIVNIVNKEGKLIEVYSVPTFLSFSNLELLLSLRKEYIKNREYWLSMQNEFSSERNFEGAKFASSESKYYLKLYNAICYVIPYFLNEYSKDCIDIPVRYWPIDLTEYYDIILHELEDG